MNAPEWLHALHEPELRAVVLTHARLRRRVRDAYLLKAAATLDGSPWQRAGALLSALTRYQASGYRVARRLGKDDRDALHAAMFGALAFGPCPGSRRGLWNVLKRGAGETSITPL